MEEGNCSSLLPNTATSETKGTSNGPLSDVIGDAIP